MELIVKMTGESAHLMHEMDSSKQCDEHGVLYRKCEKALYGHIKTARLFCNDLDLSIQQKRYFNRTKYDPCVYNKRMKDGAIMIRVHVDELKISANSRKNWSKQLRNYAIYMENLLFIGVQNMITWAW